MATQCHILEWHVVYCQNIGNGSCGNTVPYPRVAPESTTNMLLYTMIFTSHVYLRFLPENIKIKQICFSHIRGRTEGSTVLRNVFESVRD